MPDASLIRPRIGGSARISAHIELSCASSGENSAKTAVAAYQQKDYTTTVEGLFHVKLWAKGAPCATCLPAASRPSLTGRRPQRRQDDNENRGRASFPDQAVLLAAGADEGNAEVVARHLVRSNLSGVDTHGIWTIPIYVAGMLASELLPAGKPGILQETPTSALVTGNWTFGHVAAKYAMELAISKARAQNMAVVGIVQLHHIGRLGTYVEMAAAENMIGMVWGRGLRPGGASVCAVRGARAACCTPIRSQSGCRPVRSRR